MVDKGFLGDGLDADALMQDISLHSPQGRGMDSEQESGEEAEAQFLERLQVDGREDLADPRDVYWPSILPLSPPLSSNEKEAEVEATQRPSLTVKLKFGDHRRMPLAGTLNVPWLSSSLLSLPPTSNDDDEEEVRAAKAVQRSSRSVTPDFWAREKILDEVLAEILDESRPSNLPLSSPPRGEKEEKEPSNNRHSGPVVTPNPCQHAMTSLAETLSVHRPSRTLCRSPPNNHKYENLRSEATRVCAGSKLHHRHQTRRELPPYPEIHSEVSPRQKEENGRKVGV